MDELMMGTIYLEVINAILAGMLLYVYLQNYRALKSTAGMGLMIFSGILLLENLGGLYLHFSTGDVYTKIVATQVFVLKIIQTFALAILVYSAWKE